MTIEELMQALARPIEREYYSTKTIQRNKISFVAWPILADILDKRIGAHRWNWEIISAQNYQDLKHVTDEFGVVKELHLSRVIVTGRMTVMGSDREISRDSIGCELNTIDNYGDPATKAEAQAFRRACAKLGLGRELWRKIGR